jgi:transcription antitermination protein NusB
MKPPAGDSEALSPRSAARIAAVQALYQMDLAGTDLNDVIAEFLTLRLGEKAEDCSFRTADRSFFTDLLKGVVRRQREIDPIIDQQLAQGWRLDRIDSTLRAVLRSAVFELVERSDVPARVVISEYVDVAKAFFGGDEPKVVNGVLDRLAKKLRDAEFKS